MAPIPDDSSSPYLFLSYATSDRERAIRVAANLESTGVPVWFDQQGTSAGTTWAGEIVAAIRGCQAVVVLCSGASLRSCNVRQELQPARDHDVPIAPVILESVEFPDAVLAVLHASSAAPRPCDGADASE